MISPLNLVAERLCCNASTIRQARQASGVAETSLRPPLLSRRTLFLGASAAGFVRQERRSAASSDTFYERWPYAQPSDIIPYLESTTTPGNAASVIAGELPQFVQVSINRMLFV